MIVYVVMASGDEDRTDSRGVFANKADAKKVYNELKKDWKEWSKGCEREMDEWEDSDGTLHFSLVNYEADESELQVMLKKEEVR